MKNLLGKKWLSLFLPALFISFFSLSSFGIVGISSAEAYGPFSPLPYASGGDLVFPAAWQPPSGHSYTIAFFPAFYDPPAASPFDIPSCPSPYDCFIGDLNHSDTYPKTFSEAGWFYAFVPGRTYYVYVYDYDGSFHYLDYFQFVFNPGAVVIDPGTPPDTSTRIIDISPAQNEVVASSSPDISGTFYNESPVYDQLLVNLSWVEPSVNADLLLSGLAHRQFIFDIGTSTSNQTFSTTTDDLLTGRWLMSAQFSSGSDGFNYFTATTTTFVVGTTTTFYSDYVEYATSTSTTTPGAPISDCAAASNIIEKAICSLGDRIKDVLQFLFVPDATVVSRFSELKENILSRVPFGYFPLFKSALDGVSASSTPIFSMVIPVASIPRFSDVRSGLGWIILFWFVVHMWRRFKHVQL